ncbi:SMI1/KNR4 family protein [Deinococcus sp. KNUC1210]|uniref:SMI1/KNR4 family protein n=1 Tax=Deinococcus sp. KNUC1210 TaxID=2917691 RepID=UPI001EF015B6|nr:SMI1/KNR4 family protein [Deinococcus sp. KNUC1210]ULH16140.1 SMI1/KNR4 family protein [Deinococcus sp. KNUC1210]
MLLDELFPTLEIDHESLRNSGRHPGNFPVTIDALQNLQATYSKIPEDYLEIIKQIDGLAIQTRGRQSPIFYISLLSAEEAVEYATSWYPFLSEDMPGCFFFAQTGDHSYMFGNRDGLEGVFKIETSVADWEDAKYIAPSIRAFLCGGRGLSNA